MSFRTTRGELEGPLLQGKGVICQNLVGVLNLLEDLLEFFLSSLVVHHLDRSFLKKLHHNLSGLFNVSITREQGRNASTAWVWTW
jgi:hypothetical protein